MEKIKGLNRVIQWCKSCFFLRFVLGTWSNFNLLLKRWKEGFGSSFILVSKLMWIKFINLHIYFIIISILYFFNFLSRVLSFFVQQTNIFYVYICLFSVLVEPLSFVFTSKGYHYFSMEFFNFVENLLLILMTKTSYESWQYTINHLCA